jgi:hypothetical protein
MDVTMVPTLVHQIGLWLDRFEAVLSQWEFTLQRIEQAYLCMDSDSIASHCGKGEAIHAELASCKQARLEMLATARQMGMRASHFQELAVNLDDQWPALWTHRIGKLELQLDRVQRLSTSLWVGAFQSKSIVSDMLLILATGRSESATYSPTESRSIEGGFLVNEAA